MKSDDKKIATPSREIADKAEMKSANSVGTFEGGTR